MFFASGELEKKSVTEEISATASDGKNYRMNFYNLDAIISVGYRVNSAKATKFRIWATGILKEYIKKGFVLDDERLKQGNAVFGKDYFKELLERVRSIRVLGIQALRYSRWQWKSQPGPSGRESFRGIRDFQPHAKD